MQFYCSWKFSNWKTQTRSLELPTMELSYASGQQLWAVPAPPSWRCLITMFMYRKISAVFFKLFYTFGFCLLLSGRLRFSILQFFYLDLAYCSCRSLRERVLPYRTRCLWPSHNLFLARAWDTMCCGLDAYEPPIPRRRMPPLPRFENRAVRWALCKFAAPFV